MKNTLGDLNNHLFAQLERLGDEDTKGEELMEEINRAKAVTSVASQIVANGSLVLRGKELQLEHGFDGEEKSDENGKSRKQLPPMLRAEFLRE